MHKELHIAMALLVGAALCCSCSKESVMAYPQAQVIQFTPALSQSTQTSPTSRAASITTATLSNFGVLASHSASAYNASADSPSYTYNYKAVKNGASWQCEQMQYWPPTGMLSFFAYAPYNPVGLTISPSDRAGLPTYTYHVTQAVASQVDLLASAPVYDKTKGAPVALTFSHLLSGLRFAAKKEAGVTTTMTVKGISLTGLNNQALCTYNSTSSTYQWSGHTTTTPADNDYNVTVSDGTLAEKVLTETAQDLYLEGGLMMVLPQTLANGVTLLVRVDYKTNNVVQEQVYQVQLNTTTLKALDPSNIYTVTISLSSKILVS
ncbi:MAG: fimbrillin family protein [Mucinivorans sp.]